jgi:hypothetical protein
LAFSVVVHDDGADPEVRRVGQRQRPDVDPRLRQGPGDLGEPPDLFSRKIDICSTFMGTPSCLRFSACPMIRLAFPSLRWIALRLHELDLAGDAQHVLDLALHLAGEPPRALHGVVKTDSFTSTCTSRTSSDSSRVTITVVALHALDRHQHGLDLRREDVDRRG